MNLIVKLNNPMTDPQILPETQGQPTDDVTRLQALSDEHLEGWRRAKADYLNLKKQTEKEKMDIAQFAVAQTIMSFLPIYDNLARALQHVPAEAHDQEWVKGLGHIRKQFEDAIKSLGLTIIPTVGQPFDPLKHHAVSKQKREGVEPGTILDEVKSGFMAGDRVLEPASVVVAE